MLPASEPSLSSSSVQLGSPVTIYTNRQQTDYTHTISYSFGSTSGTIATGVGDYVSWTPPTSLASQIPSGTSGTCTITCDTYYAGALTGTKYCYLTLTVSSGSASPVINYVSHSEATYGLAAQFGVYVQGKSSLYVSISASGSLGSSITSYRATVNGSTYTSSSFTTGILTSSGTNYISVTVTDSRGLSASTSYAFTVYAYQPPSITSFSMSRCNSAGSAVQIDGTRAWYSLSASAASVNARNTMSCTIYYKLKTVQTWTTATTVSHTNYGISQANMALSSSIVFNVLNSYDVRVTVSDYFGSVNADATLNTKQVVFDVLADGSG